MKSVMISIRPKWCELIASGKKTVEVRKTRPNLQTPFKCYIYCTKGHFHKEYSDTAKAWKENALGKVIGEFTCSSVECFTTDYRRNEEQTARISRLSCLDMVSLMEYEANAPCLYGWHISNLVIYDDPKPLGMFYKECAGLYDMGMCWECEKAVGEECECATNGRVFLDRPPQSWCYVEELQ